MTVLSGLYGNATWVVDADTGTCETPDTAPTTGFVRVCHLTKWTMRRVVANSTYVTNMTNGNARTAVGAKSATGTIETLICDDADDANALKAGDRVRLRLYLAPLLGHEITVVLTDDGEDVDLAGTEIRRTYSWSSDDNSPKYNTVLAAAVEEEEEG